MLEGGISDQVVLAADAAMTFAVCGSSLPNKLDSEETVWIPAGLLDGPTFSTVAKHFFELIQGGLIGGAGVQYDELPIR
jgi:hypothetical protein